MMQAVSCSGLTVYFDRNSGIRSSGTTVHFRKNKQYEKLGFEKHGTFPDNMKFADGSYMDAYWMMKKL